MAHHGPAVEADRLRTLPLLVMVRFGEFYLPGSALVALANTWLKGELEKLPNDGFALCGVAQSLDAQGKGAQAAEVRRQLGAAWIRADTMPKSSRF